ncbi:MAG: thermonuclease family protein [Candidatus Binatia bacterium]
MPSTKRYIRRLRSHNRAHRLAWVFLSSIVALFGLAFFNEPGPALTDGNFRIVQRVIDGDTVMMQNGERIRLIGVDTPETKHPRKPVERYGKEASAFTKAMVEGKRVRLEYDQANAARNHKDSTPQRRTLAYVFLENGMLLNAEIIRQGYGFAYTQAPFGRMEEFRRLERQARNKRKGLWAEP